MSKPVSWDDLPPEGKLIISEPGEPDEGYIAPDFSANTNLVDRTPYIGQYVAWSTDGRRIIDFDPSLATLLDRLTRQGKLDTEFVVEGVSGPQVI